MAYVSTLISAVASLGVLTGLISGIFFLVLTALRWVSRVRENLYEEELRRQKKFFIKNSYLVDVGASNFLETRKAENGSEISSNEHNFSDKIDDQFQSSAEDTTEWSNQTDLKAAEKKDSISDAVKVRELIEKMVERIIGGPLDGTTVGQLSTHSACKNVFEVDSIDLQQLNLKRLIKRIVSEAMALPNIRKILCRPKTSKEIQSEDFKNKSYEDILATAILNKVIENFQKKNQKEDEDSENSKPRLRNKKIRRNDEDGIKSDGDWSDTSRSDQLSLTIEEYIEEVTTALEVSEDEKSDLSDSETTSNRRVPFPESGKTVVDAGTDDENSDLEEQNTATELITSTNSWEENWLFQKKRLRSTPNVHHPVPVPMLVPNPSEDFRALVGGVNADDLSDMSDCSDSVLEDIITETEEKHCAQILNTEYKEAIHNCSIKEEEFEKEKVKEIQTHFFENKQDEVLGTRIPNENEKNCDSSSQGKCQDSANDEKCTAQEAAEDEEENLISSTSSEVLSQKDRDSLTEDFYPQRESKHSFSPSERITQVSTSCKSQDCTLRCRMAEKEKEKWMNPVPLAENPYSLENIEKREQMKRNDYFRIGTYTGESINFPDDLSSDELSRKETEKLRFSRDYYVNASKHPSGMSSPSLNQHSEECEQEFENTLEVALLEKENKSTVRETQDEKTNDNTRNRKIDKTQFSLPSVKELAKQFAAEDSKDLKNQSSDLHSKLESKHKSQYVSTNEFPEKEPEIDYSTVPVSKIILNLQQAAKGPVREYHSRPIIYNTTLSTTGMEICRKVDGDLVIENPKKLDKVGAARFNGKQVHSLTARSISKEFREGLKNNSYQKVFPKSDRISSGGESDQGDIVCSKTKTSPTPSVDLKNMKKFWEEIIIANSNFTKQK